MLPVPVVPTAGGSGHSTGTSPSRDSGVANSLSPSIRGRSESVVGPEGYKKTRRAIITASKEGVIVSCNNAARFLFGYPLGSMVGARVERLMPEPYASRHQAHLDAHVAAAGKNGNSSAFGAWK
jgi:PAS domain-containing protein